MCDRFRDRRLMSRVLYCHSLLHFLRQCFSLKCELSVQLDQLARELWGPPCGDPGTFFTPGLLNRWRGYELRSPCLHSKHFSHLPCPRPACALRIWKDLWVWYHYFGLSQHEKIGSLIAMTADLSSLFLGFNGSRSMGPLMSPSHMGIPVQRWALPHSS